MPCHPAAPACVQADSFAASSSILSIFAASLIRQQKCRARSRPQIGPADLVALRTPQRRKPGLQCARGAIGARYAAAFARTG
jgi:hypothetical protein